MPIRSHLFPSYLTLFAALTIFSPLAVLSAPLTNDTSMLSVTNSEAISNGASTAPSVSTDKNLVAFLSSSTNLQAPNTTGTQVFLRNRSAGTTTLLSKTGSTSGDGVASAVALSADGATVSFATAAKNLIGTPGAASSVYSRAIATGILTHVSDATNLNVATASNTAPSISSDGTKITFLTNRAFAACGSASNVILSLSGALSCVSSSSTIASLVKTEARLSSDGE